MSNRTVLPTPVQPIPSRPAARRRRVRRVGPAVAGIGLMIATLSACGSSSSGSAASGGSASMSPSMSPSMSSSMSASPTGGPSSSGGSGTSMPVITIKNYGYSGATRVPAGATVTVKNDDTVTHTVTADSGGAFDVMVQGGSTVTFKAPSKAGSYPYHCDYHAEMHGTLTVS